MTTPFNITDADVSAALSILDTHANTMRTTISQVESIGSDIGSAYRSNTSSQFQQQLQNWGEIYGQLMQKVNRVREDLQQANNVIGNTAEESTQKVHTVGSTITDILAG